MMTMAATMATTSRTLLMTPFFHQARNAPSPLLLHHVASVCCIGCVCHLCQLAAYQAPQAQLAGCQQGHSHLHCFMGGTDGNKYDEKLVVQNFDGGMQKVRRLLRLIQMT